MKFNLILFSLLLSLAAGFANPAHANAEKYELKCQIANSDKYLDEKPTFKIKDKIASLSLNGEKDVQKLEINRFDSTAKFFDGHFFVRITVTFIQCIYDPNSTNP